MRKPTGQITTITPWPGDDEIGAYAVNHQGQIVGKSVGDPNFGQTNHFEVGFRWDP